MGTLNIRSDRNIPIAQSENVYTIKHRTQEQMEQVIRENWKLMDEMLEPGQYLGVYPF